MRAETQTYSNLALCATFENASSELTPSILLPALRAVIIQHPSLGAIPVKQRVGDKHQIWEGRLRNIDVAKVVEWRDEVLDDLSNGFSCVMNELHNEVWFPIDATDRPRWKIVVLGRRHVIFLCDHFVADGQSAYTFQRSLLKALNSSLPAEKDTVVEVPDVPPPPPWTEQCGVQFSIWPLLRGYVNMKAFRAFYWPSTMLFSNATPDDRPVATVLSETKRPKTRVVAVHINQSIQAKLQKLTRKHGASLNSLTLTILTMALAEIYPHAIYGLTNCPYSVRTVLDPPRSSDEIGNIAVTFESMERLQPYRQAETNADEIWRLAADYKRRVDYDRTVSKRGFQGTLGMKMISDTMEDFITKGCPNFATMMRGGFRLSNIGLFQPGKEWSEQSAWKITDVHFSQPIEKSTVGSAGINFSMAGAEGAGFWLYASYEEGVLPDDVAQKTLSGLEVRLEDLAG